MLKAQILSLPSAVNGQLRQVRETIIVAGTV